MFIMQGASGSGKTTVASGIAKAFNALVCSTVDGCLASVAPWEKVDA